MANIRKVEELKDCLIDSNIVLIYKPTDSMFNNVYAGIFKGITDNIIKMHPEGYNVIDDFEFENLIGWAILN